MNELKQTVSGWAQVVAKNAGWLIALGVLTVIAGFMAIASPLAAGLGIAAVVGVAMLIAGVARTIGAFGAGSFGQGALAFIGGMRVARAMADGCRPGTCHGLLNITNGGSG